MHASVRALLEQIIDYAGLFPPAKLPLEQAVQQYLQYRQSSPHRWMLGRFVCPAARLGELLAVAKAPVPVAALGRQSAAADTMLADLQADIAAVEAYRRECGNHPVVEALEFALPRSTLVEDLRHVWQKVRAAANEGDLKMFVEPPTGPHWDALVDFLCAAGVDGRIGLKMRCGGVTAEAFPKPDLVTRFVARCKAAKAPWKATAGLHHPRQSWDPALQIWHHGFLNLFVAGVMTWNHALSEVELLDIVKNGSLRVLRFDENSLAWRNRPCTLGQISDARAHFATSFGSCSFEEPCADLIAMGLID